MNKIGPFCQHAARRCWESPKGFLIALVIVFILIQGGLFLHAMEQDPLFRHAVVDEWEYVATAKHLLWWPDDPTRMYWHPPLQAWFLTGVMKLTGWRDIAALKSLNIPLFALTLPMIFGLFVRLWPQHPNRCRVLTLCWALWPLNLLFNLTLLGTALYLLLVVGSLYFAYARPSVPGVLAACLGTAYCRYYSVVLGPLIIAFSPAFSRWKRVALVLAVLGGFFWLPWHNHRLTGHWSLDPQTFTNFCVGNSEDVKASIEVRPEDWRTFGSELIDEYGGSILKRGLALPLSQWTVNIAQKTGYLLGGREISRNRDLARMAAGGLGEHPHLINLLLSLPFALLLAAAIPGLLRFSGNAWTRQAQWCSIAQVLIMGAVMVFFFPVARYRLYWLPFLFVLAGCGLDLWKAGRKPLYVTSAFAAFLISCLAGFWPAPEIPEWEESVRMAERAAYTGDSQTLELLRPEAKSWPDTYHLLKGKLYFMKGDRANAELEYRQALEINPDQWEAYWKLYILHEFAGNRQEAQRWLSEYGRNNQNHLAIGVLILRARFERRYDVLADLRHELPLNSEEGLLLSR